MRKRIIQKIAQLLTLTYIPHDTISVSLTTYPVNQAVDVDIWDLSSGKPELKEHNSICFDAPDAQTQMDSLINKVRGFYGELAA